MPRAADDELDADALAFCATQGISPGFLQLMRRQHVSADDFDEQLAVMRRPDRLYHLLLFGEGLPPEMLQKLLRAWWTDSEVPSGFGTDHLVKLFTRAGFVTDADDVTAPTEPLTVFRGVQGDSTAKGMSWTLDHAKAAWFAGRWPFLAPGTVYAAEIPPQHVLGIFHDRQEAEVVVNPRRLRKLRALDVEPARRTRAPPETTGSADTMFVSGAVRVAAPTSSQTGGSVL